MRVWNKNRNWLQAVLLTTFLGSAAVVSAQTPEPLHRIGRLWGVGWGDGYHACSSSGFHPCADLPPRSYSSLYGRRTHAAPHLSHRSDSTFYDRFDADNGRICGADHACDAPGCAVAPLTVVDGSQVTREIPLPVEEPSPGSPAPQSKTPQLDAPQSKTPQLDAPQSKTPQLDAPQPNTPQLDAPRLEAPTPAAPINSPQPDPQTAALGSPREPLAVAKKYPIRPLPPQNFTPRKFTFPVVSNRSESNGFGLAPPTVDKKVATPVMPSAPVALPPSDAYWPPAASQNPVSSQTPIPSKTPGLIHPVHPSESEANQEAHREVLDRTVPITPLPKKTAPTPIESSRFESKPPTSPALQPHVPSYASEPPTATKATPSASVASSILPESLAPRPHRLGSQGTDSTAHPSGLVSRPTRLGGSDSVKANPLTARPTLELAKRPREFSESVIHQPGNSSLK